jgi:hypothetical protein
MLEAGGQQYTLKERYRFALATATTTAAAKVTAAIAVVDPSEVFSAASRSVRLVFSMFSHVSGAYKRKRPYLGSFPVDVLANGVDLTSRDHVHHDRHNLALGVVQTCLKYMRYQVQVQGESIVFSRKTRGVQSLREEKC